MAKFFITNNSDYYKSIKNQIASTKFSLSFDNECDGVYAIAVHKLEIQNENAIKEGDDFCIATGTCIYREDLDYRLLLRDFSQEEMPGIREKAIGSYGVCVNKNHEVTIFTDPLGSYDIFYYNKNNVIVISNSLYDMAMALKEDIHLVEQAIFERTICRSVMNGQSFFDEIYRLRGDEYLQIIDHELRIVTIDTPIIPLQPAKDEDYEIMVRRTAERLKDNARIIGKVFGTPTLCTTGGLDSRMVLAAFLSNGIKPYIYYGKNNVVANPWTYSQEQDAKIAELYAKRFNLDVTFDNWSIKNPVDKDWNILIKNHGFLAAYVWGASATMINNITQHSTACLVFGWTGELYRVSMNKHQCDSLYNYTKDVYVAKSVDVQLALETEPQFVKMMYQRLKQEYDRLGLNPFETNNDELFMLEVLYRSQADTQIPSFLMQYKYCYLPAFEHNVLTNRVSWNKLDKARFQIDVINALFPQVFELPIYSANKYRYLNKKTMMVEDELKQVKNYLILEIPSKIVKKAKRFIRKRLKIFEKKKETIIVSNEFPEYNMPPTDIISNQQYNIDSKSWRYTENAAIWGILHRALKILGY